MHLRLLFLCLLFPLLTAEPVSAQRQLGVQWEVPGDRGELMSQLRTFRQLELSHLEVDRPLPEAAWDSIRASGMQVWAAVPLSYPTRCAFAAPDSATVGHAGKLSSGLHRHAPSVTAVRLFRHGAMHDARFREALAPFLQQIRSSYGGDLYHLRSLGAAGRPMSGGTGTQQGSGRLDFFMQHVPVRAGYTQNSPLLPAAAADHDAAASMAGDGMPGAWLYQPDEEMAPYLGPFKRLLEETADRPDAPLFIPSGWLIDNLERHPTLGETLQLFATEGGTVFPLPEESYPTEDRVGMGVLLLFLLWGSVALHYSLSPIYRRSIRRFFVSHRFYVNDVLHRHVRVPAQGVIMMLQHAVLTGLLLYSLGSYLLTPAGTQALVHHLPGLTLFGGVHFSFFCWGALGTLLVESISILWLLGLNKRIRFFSQVTNLYNWPLQANLVTVTVLFALMVARPGGGGIAVGLLLIVFLLFFLGSFVLTAFDTSRLLTNKRAWFLLSTVGLYLLLLTGGTGWMLGKTDLWAILSLALQV
ncbi:MAG: hypothetical protein U5K31_04865 [Balneolaceae bacterium]|nr:hypothetical protein [Balneolaceae bacterium]